MVTQTQVPYLSGKVVLLDRAKDHFQFTSDAVEVWVHGDLPRGLRRETVAKLGVGPWSSDIIRPRGSRWKCQLGVRKGLGHFSALFGLGGVSLSHPRVLPLQLGLSALPSVSRPEKCAVLATE